MSKFNFFLNVEGPSVLSFAEYVSSHIVKLLVSLTFSYFLFALLEIYCRICPVIIFNFLIFLHYN